MKQKFLLLILALGLGLPSFAQTDSTKVQEEEPPLDFSQFGGDMEESTSSLKDGVKRYCTSKVFGISPTKLISLSYDYQLGFDMKANASPNPASGDLTTYSETQKVSSMHGLRFIANFPVISKNSLTVNLGATYFESNYQFATPNTLASGLTKSLNATPLRSTGINITVFKPLNEKHFLLFQTSHDLNGDYRLGEMDLGLTKHSVLAVFGWKKHDRLQWGLGASRTYRVGALNYIPVVLYNYTSENRKWGVEAVFPARVAYRRSFSPRSILLFGYELEGNSYALQNRVIDRQYAFGEPMGHDLELRRSEMRIRLTYEKALTQFIWLSVQAGYRYNWRNSYNIDKGDPFRSFFSTDPYHYSNMVTNPLYFNIGINLVSP
jgi:hypothetical protein